MQSRILPQNKIADNNTSPSILPQKSGIKKATSNTVLPFSHVHSFSQLTLLPCHTIQPKLTVNQPNDQLEQEADTVADKVIDKDNKGSSSLRSVKNQSVTNVQRKCDECEKEEKKVQRKTIPNEAHQQASTRAETFQSIDNKISEQQGRGTVLDRDTHAFMTQRFGVDFSNVKIHADNEAAEMSRKISARAFTVGDDIYFNEGQYQPKTKEGKHLLAHELTHTVQQQNNIRRKPTPTDLYGRPLGFVDTPEQEEYDKDSARIKDNLLEILRNGFPGTKDNSYLLKVINEKYAKGSDDYWLATNLLKFGPETMWPATLLAELRTKSDKNGWNFAEGSLGTTAGGRNIDSFYFQGQTENHALIIGGVHGSELSGTEVVEILIEKLKKGPKPYYTVIVVPSLFPDNAAAAKDQPEKIETGENVGRYTKGTESTAHSTDPNRQFPAFGKGYDPATKKDTKGRTIEPENIVLLELIDRFKPSRIASVHSNHDLDKAGIYADPRTDSSGKALGYDTDKALAEAMANTASSGGANVPGNKLTGGKATNAVYPLDPAAAATGKQQKRETDKGNSLGGWGSTAVCDPANAAANRPAMRIITVEVQLAKRSTDVAAAEQAKRKVELEAHADALKDIFLGPNQVETAVDPCAVAPKP